MKPNEYFENKYSVYHINDVVELKDLESLHSLIEEYAKHYHEEQVKSNSVLGDVIKCYNCGDTGRAEPTLGEPDGVECDKCP